MALERPQGSDHQAGNLEDYYLHQATSNITSKLNSTDVDDIHQGLKELESLLVLLQSPVMLIQTAGGHLADSALRTLSSTLAATAIARSTTPQTASFLVSAASTLASNLNPTSINTAAALASKTKHGLVGDSAQLARLEKLVAHWGYRRADFEAAQVQVLSRIHTALSQDSNPFRLPNNRGEVRKDEEGGIGFGSSYYLNKALSSAASAHCHHHHHQQQQQQQQQQQLTSVTYSNGVKSSSIVLEIQNQVLPVLRQLPIEGLKGLSQEGWTSWFSLDIQAMYRVLEQTLQLVVTTEIEQAAAQNPNEDHQPDAHQLPPSNSNLAGMLEQHPQICTALKGIAYSPALHIHARKVLHFWLAQSGNLAVWRLLQYLLHLSSSTKAIESATDSTSMQYIGGLPEELKALYPGELHKVAGLMRSLPQDAASLIEIYGMLNIGIAPTLETAPISSQSQKHANSTKINKQSIELCTEIWKLVLDNPAWILLASKTLQHPRPAVAAPGTHHQQEGVVQAALESLSMSPKSLDITINQAGNSAALISVNKPEESSQEVSSAAAGILAWLLWPQNQSNRALLQQALIGNTEEIDTEAIAPWIDTLELWREACDSLLI